MITAHRVLTLLLLTCTLSLKAGPTVAPAGFNYAAAIAEARRDWTEDARIIADWLRKIAAASARGGKAETDLNREKQGLSALLRERDQTMDELRNGAFCTGCGKTRSVIEAAGETFPHPGQQRRPATPEELASAERGFQARIDVIQRRISNLEAEINRARDDVLEAYHRYLVQKTPFFDHMAQEQQARLGKWLDERTRIQQETAVLRDAVTAAAKEVKQANDADQKRTAQATLDSRQEQFARKVTSGKLAEDRALQEEKLFRRDAGGSIDHLADIARPIPDRYGASGWFIATTLRSLPKPIGYTVPSVYLTAPSAELLKAGSSASGDLQDLLDGKTSPKPDDAKPKSGEKSLKDILDGK